MTLPKTYRVLEDWTHDALLETDMTRDIVRKAGLTGGTSAENVGLIGGIMGTFSLLNSAAGYVLTYPSGTSLFPDGIPSMQRYADTSSISEVRLFSTVVSAGSAGSTLRVESAALPVACVISLSTTGVKFSDWLSLPSDEAVFEWSISATSGGSVTLGLTQLQGR